MKVVVLLSGEPAPEPRRLNRAECGEGRVKQGQAVVG